MLNKFHFPIILLLILLAIFSGLYGAKFGLDVTDTGFFLYSQYRLLNGGMTSESIQHLAIGSDWIGALWVYYVADNSLYIAKVGGVFLRFTVLTFVYMTVSNILKDKVYSAYLTIFSYFAFSSVFGFMIINYDLAPLLPISIIMWLLSIDSKENSSQPYIFLLIGSLLAASTLMRIPLVLIPTLFITYLFLTKRYVMNGNIFFTVMGFFTVILILVVVPTLNIAFQPLVETFSGVIDGFFKVSEDSILAAGEGHDAQGQLLGWLKSYFRLLIAAVLIFFLVYKIPASSSLYLVKKYSYIAIFLITFVLLFTLPQWIEVYGISLDSIRKKFLFSTIVPVLVIFSVYVLLYKFNIKENERNLSVFIIILLLIFPVGSNSFGHKFSITYIVILPILFSIMINNIDNKANKIKLLNSMILSRLKWLIVVVTVSTLMANIINFHNKPYRDSSVFNLKSKIDAAGLKGVRTTKERSIAISNVLNWIEKNSNKGDTLLAYGKISIFNFLLKLPGVFDLPWPSYLPVLEFSNKLRLLKLNDNLPKFIALPLLDVDNNVWPLGGNKSSISSTKNMHILQKEINQYYKQGFISNEFVVYVKRGDK